MHEGGRTLVPARVAAGVLALGIAAALGGCAEMRPLRAQPSHPVNLAGTWTLDPLHSTDGHKALQHLLEVAGKRTRNLGSYGNMPPGGVASSDDALLGLGATMHFAPDISLQRSLLAGAAWLKIEQGPDELIIANAETSHTFVPGERTVVSVPSGVADQRSGWKGQEFWIELSPQVGPGATEKLQLSPDGKQLIETIEVGSEGPVPSLEVRRVYLPTSHIPASPVPSDD